MKQGSEPKDTGSKQSWGTITEDLKHSASLWDLLEIRTQKQADDNPMNEVRQEIEKIKDLLQEHNF